MSGSVTDALRGAGQVTGTGKLEIDRARAREKMRRFRLASPYLYVLQFVSAASIAGASRIEFEIDADEMECVFDVPIPRQLVGNLWTRAYGTRTDALDHVAYQLALGLGSAQALHPRELVLETSAHGGATLRLTTNVEELIAGCTEFGEGTRIYLREKFRFGHLVEFFAARQGTLAELEVLEKSCAVSWLDVRVNGEQFSYGRDPQTDVPRHRFSNLNGRGELELTAENRFELRLLKHDVLVGSWAGKAHGVGAVGRIGSPNFRTDLTRFGLIRDVAFRRLATGLVYGEYHQAIADRLEDLDRDTVMRLAATVYDWTSWVRTQQFRLPAGSRRLANAMLEQPIWRRADAQNEYASFLQITEAHDGAFAFSRNSAWSVETDDVDRVAFLPIAPATVTVNPSIMRHALERMCRWTDARSVDVTDVLERARKRATNRALWRARPRSEPPRATYQVCAAIRDRAAWAFVPIEEHGHAPPRAVIRIDGRTVAERDGATPFSVVLDGDFEPNAAFSDIVADDALETLLTKLVCELPDAMRTYADDVVAGTAPLEPALVRHWIRACLDGSFVPGFLSQFGLSPQRVSGRVKRTGIWPRALLLDQIVQGGPPDDPTAVLDTLGAVVDVPAFVGPDGSPASLRELAQLPNPVFLRASQSERFVPLETDEAEAFDVLEADGDTARILELLLGARPGVSALREYRWMRRFMARPRFESPELGDALRHVEEVGAQFTLDAYLEREASDPGCAISFVYRGRLLGTARLELAVGRVRIVARSDALSPDETWTDIAPDDTAREIVKAAATLSESLVNDWWLDCARSGRIPDERTARTLYFRCCIDRFVERRERLSLRSLPVVRIVDDELRRERWSHIDLTARAHENGACLPVVGTGDVDRDALRRAGCPALELGSVPRGTAEALFLRCRVLDVSATGDVRARARRQFLKKPRVTPDLSSSPVVVDIDIGSIRGIVSWEHGSLKTHVQRPQAHVRALHEGRVLEVLTVPVPFGHFRAILHGPGIEPDPTHSFVATGRPDLLEATMKGAVAAIREGCRRFSRSGAEPDLLDSLRPDLWQLLGRLRTDGFDGPFGRLTALLDEPLFQCTSGRWRSYDELDEIARWGQLPIAGRGASDRILLVRDELRPIAQRALADWPLVPASRLGLPLYEVARPSPDATPTQRLSTLLLAVRGTHTHLLDDYLARRIRWVEGGDRLCAVDENGITLTVDHPLVTAVIKNPNDDGALAFLASVVYSEVNRHYRMITDHDELTFQRRFLELMRR